MAWRRGVLEMIDFRTEVVREALRSGANRTSVALRYGISRATLNRWVARHRTHGDRGLEPWSRVPLRSPRQIDAGLEDDIRRLRKDNPRWGARRIAGELIRAGLDPPAVSTIHQVLVRNGLVAVSPRKSKATKRFQRDHPHDLWQIDATAIALSTNRVCWVMDVIDDCSRALLAIRVCSGPTGQAAIDTFNEAVAAHGLPREVLSDNGSCFTGRLQRGEVAFERVLKGLGVRQIHSRPLHPQTLGKLERFHRTMKEWVIDHFPIESPDELQAALDRFKDHYNDERPHQSLDNRVPGDVVMTSPMPIPPTTVAEPDLGPLHPADAITRAVGDNGAFTYKQRRIGIGVRWAGHRVRVEEGGDRISVYYGGELIRSLVFNDRTRYQPWKGQRRKPK